MTNQAQNPNVTITSRFWTRYLNMTVTNALPYQWRALNDEVPVDVPEGAAGRERQPVQPLAAQSAHRRRSRGRQVLRTAVPGHRRVEVA